MASIRKRDDKWQVQIRRRGHGQVTKSFGLRKDALEWARDRERQADRGDLPKDSKVLKELTLGDLIRRYQGAVSVHKCQSAFKFGSDAILVKLRLFRAD
jgi:hypothetical protein